MVPFVALVVVTLVLFGVSRVRSWPWVVAVRGGLAAMFALTGGAHFIGMREELISMVPPALPAPGLLVTITGILELAAVVGLLWRPTAPWAAAGLTGLLLAMFPANVHKALTGDNVPWDDQLVPRGLMQVVFLAATVSVVVYYRRDVRERVAVSA